MTVTSSESQGEFVLILSFWCWIVLFLLSGPASCLLWHLLAYSSSLLKKTLSLLPSHLITPHLLLSSLLLFFLSCPPHCDLLSAFLHAPDHCMVHGGQGCLWPVLNNIHKEALFIQCPSLFPLKLAGTNLKYSMLSMTGNVFNLFWAAAQSNRQKACWACEFLVDVIQQRMGHIHALKVEGDSCFKD